MWSRGTRQCKLMHIYITRCELLARVINCRLTIAANNGSCFSCCWDVDSVDAQGNGHGVSIRLVFGYAEYRKLGDTCVFFYVLLRGKNWPARISFFVEMTHVYNFFAAGRSETVIFFSSTSVWRKSGCVGVACDFYVSGGDFAMKTQRFTFPRTANFPANAETRHSFSLTPNDNVMFKQDCPVLSHGIVSTSTKKTQRIRLWSTSFYF